MSECTVLTLNEELNKGNGMLLDVREYAEYASGRVMGAELLPLGEIESRHKEIDTSKPIYVMCRSGNRSAQAQKKLKGLGFIDVINVKGGFTAWKKENLPFEKDEKAPWDLERQVRFVAGLLTLTGVLLAIFVHFYFIGLAAFIGVGLTFSALTNTCTMGMVLSKMPWNRKPVTCETGVSTVK